MNLPVYKLSNEIEDYWKTKISTEQLPLISEPGGMKLLLEELVEIFNKSFKESNIEIEFLIFKFPDHSSDNGIKSIVYTEKKANPYTPIRESWRSEINFSSLIYSKESLEILPTFAFYVGDKNIISNEVISFKLADIFQENSKLNEILDCLENWKLHIKNHQDVENKLKTENDLSNKINEIILCNPKEIRSVVDNFCKKNENNSVLKTLQKSQVVLSNNELDHIKFFIFLIKMALSDGSLAIFRTTPLHLGSYKSPLSIIWQLKYPEDSEVNFEELLLCSNYLMDISERLFFNKILKELSEKSLKTAIISILIDSYAHNISAHSLSALKWWFELRYKILDKRFAVNSLTGTPLGSLQPSNININQGFITTISEKYYEILGLTDSTYNKDYSSLLDYLQFNNEEEALFKYSNKVTPKVGDSFNPRFPVPIDYALYPFFRFLRDKGAFWSGVTRDMTFGGEAKTWYKILWDDFANNPLYLGTIAKSEGINKLNIYLAIRKDNEWIQGHFVTIDMSVIDYETKMANKDELYTNVSDFKSSNNANHDDCPFKNKMNECTCDNDLIEVSKYSIYSFVRPGRCFQCFRKILDKPEYSAFMPGGIVGEHALFTIFENTLRNIKHYKESLEIIKKDGINFWISIEEENLKLKNSIVNEDILANSDITRINETEVKRKSQLFKVSTWLAHETVICNEKAYTSILNTEFPFTENVDDIKDFDKLSNSFLIKKVTDSSLSSIIDPDTGAPRMGGNSQDKACAAMLFNNEFKSVERIESERDKDYFPWINFSHAKENEMMKDITLSNEYSISKDQSKKREALVKYIKKLESQYLNGVLKKSFKVWRGEDYYIINDENELAAENVSRFKIVIIGAEEKKTEIRQALTEAGVIRILEKFEITHINKENIEIEVNNDPLYKSSQNKKIETERRYFRELYRIWLKKWLNKETYTILLSDAKFGKDHETNEIINKYAYVENNKNNISYINHTAKTTSEKEYQIVLNLCHGSKEEDSRCNVRSHGQFWSYFFNDIPNKKPGDFKSHKYKNNRDHLLCEFIESIVTKIFIFDNRVFRKFENLSDTKKSVFKTNLNIEVREEDEADFNEFKNSNKPSTKNLPLILVMHLSFIETFLDDDSKNYSEDRIYEFLGKYLNYFFGADKNFYLIIVTGRGRGSWWQNLKREDKDKKFINQTLYKPVESIINAVESGISYNDNFDVKYNLCKIIFGS